MPLVPACVGRLPIPHGLGAVCLLALGALAGPALVQAGEPQASASLVLGIYANVRSTDALKEIRALPPYLRQALADKGYRVELDLKLYPTYGDGIAALTEGSLDISRLGPVAYVLAKQRSPGIRLLAMESNGGSKRFSGVISVARESPIQSVQDLRGKTLAFGERRSTTGRFLAQAALVEAGIGARDLRSHAYLDRHDKVAFAVATGNYDAGATNEDTFHQYAETKGLRKILEYPCVTKPWVARAGLEPGLFQALQQVLLELRDPAVLAGLNRTGFLAAEDGDYDLIRVAMAKAKAFDEQSLRFGTHATEQPSEAFVQIRPTLTLLEQRLATEESLEEFHIKVFSSYRDQVDALTQGDVDLARLDPASYLLAKDQDPRIRPLVREETGGALRGVILVRRDSGIRQLSDLKGKAFAFGDRNSAAGRYAAQAALIQAGVRARDLSRFQYLGRHDRVAYAVAAGNYDAGAVREEILHGDLKALAELRVIGDFPVPPALWAVRAGFDADLFDTLQGLLLTLEPGTAARRGFALPDDQAYAALGRQMRQAARFEEGP